MGATKDPKSELLAQCNFAMFTMQLPSSLQVRSFAFSLFKSFGSRSVLAKTRSAEERLSSSALSSSTLPAQARSTAEEKLYWVGELRRIDCLRN